MMRATAFLIPDQGKSALAEDYFRSAQHLRAERVTHTLLVEAGAEGALRLPLIVRPIEGTPYRDAISPYGYPGGSQQGLSGLPVDAVDWQPSELVSIFVRERLLGPRCFEGGTARNEVFLVDPRLPVEFREMHRRHIRRNAREGFVCTCRPAREASGEEREAFQEIYRQTMVRDRAAARYFFPEAYFQEVFSSPAMWLVMARAPDGHAAAAALAVSSDGVLHYYLGGTADRDLPRSPAKNVFAAMTELATRLELPLNLGGGVQPGDSLESFKRGFANASARLYTQEIVCAPAVYARLSEGTTAGSYFPAYRAPRS